ncbi:MAG: hypothetical protein B6229_00535 [Spirochaetaceae bacterium 4572_7]|nr:MAG: hypothetical protein B6229_00535 [Spirochaetaceae bacterium 4572_7]
MNNIKQKPKIGIFTKPIDQRTSGSGSHLDQLVRYILKANSKYEIVFIHYKENNINDIYDNIDDIIIPRNPFKASRILKKEKFDILHYSPLTVFAPVWLRKPKKVATIHGAAPCFLPKQYNKITIFHDKIIRPIYMRAMDFIFTVSQTSKNYFVDAFSIEDKKIGITYNAVGPEFRVTAEYKDDIINKFKIDSQFIFHLSKYSTRKNPQVILESFNILCKTNNSIKLVLAGKDWNNDYVKIFLSENNLLNRVIFPGFVSRDEIVGLLNLASVFIFPSFYEGFGMPNIEAMACGCPVITSDAFAIPEVVGDAAIILNDNTNPNELSQKIIDIVTDNSLSNKLIEKGLIQSKKYSWENSANMVLTSYDNILNNKKGGYANA